MKRYRIGFVSLAGSLIAMIASIVLFYGTLRAMGGEPPNFCSVTTPEAIPSLSPATYQKDMIARAASVYMTPRGQSYLTNSVVDAFLRNGISLEQGDFAQWAPPAFADIDLDQLSDPMQQFGPTLGNLRDTIKKWLIGFEFNNPKLSLNIQGIHYQATISRLGLRTDPVGTANLHEENSVIVDMELEIPAISVSVDSSRATDANNPILGSFGVDNFTASLAQGSKPLKFRVPVLISLDSKHNIKVQATTVQTNLPLVDIDWDFHPLVLPTVQIVINGVSTNLNYDQLEADIKADKDNLAKAAQTFLKTYLAQSGAALLNTRFQEAHINTLMDEINTMPAIAAPDNLKNPPAMLWGMSPDSIKLDKSFFEVDASMFALDPTTSDAAMTEESHESTPADLTSLNPTDYDIALTLDEAFVNRLLELSYNRGYFANMKSGTTSYKLTQAPVISADPNGQKDHVRIHAAIETVVQAKGPIQTVKYFIGLHNPLRVSFDLDVKVELDNEHSRIRLIENEFDLNSMQIDPSSVKHGLTKQDLSGVRQYFQQNLNVPLQSNLTELASIPMPRSLIGIPIQMNTAEAQTNGHFVLFFNIGDNKQ